MDTNFMDSIDGIPSLSETKAQLTSVNLKLSNTNVAFETPRPGAGVFGHIM